MARRQEFKPFHIEYSVVSSDPNGDAIFYYIDWGDNTYSGWLGPVPSGVTSHQNHSWVREDCTWSMRKRKTFTVQ